MSTSSTRYKYPRTSHLPWSKKTTSDDLQSTRVPFAPHEDIVITEKVDGENTTLYCDGLHARSIDGRGHPSRNWVKALQGRIGHLIPPDLRICGENLYAQHSIAYSQLESYFYVFSIWQEQTCLSWDDTCEWTSLLDLHRVPELYRGPISGIDLKEFHTSLDLHTQEGYVIRPTRSFMRHEFEHVVFKWVRPHHVQTSKHWMHQAIIPNQLKPPQEKKT